LVEFFKHVKKLRFDERPNYSHLVKLMENALYDKGYKDDG